MGVNIVLNGQRYYFSSDWELIELLECNADNVTEIEQSDAIWYGDDEE